MKVTPVQKSLSCSYIYFKSTDSIQKPKTTPVKDSFYNISEAFSIDNFQQRMKEFSISGTCNQQDYNIVADTDSRTITGNIGQESVNINIGEQKIDRLFSLKSTAKNAITGHIGDKEVNLMYSTNLIGTKLIGTFGTENIAIRFRKAYRFQDMYADGKKLKLTLSASEHHTHTNYQAMGKSSIDKDFLPLLTELMLVSSYTGLR